MWSDRASLTQRTVCGHFLLVIPSSVCFTMIPKSEDGPMELAKIIDDCRTWNEVRQRNGSQSRHNLRGGETWCTTASGWSNFEITRTNGIWRVNSTIESFESLYNILLNQILFCGKSQEHSSLSRNYNNDPLSFRDLLQTWTAIWGRKDNLWYFLYVTNFC